MENCYNHPERKAYSICHNCGRHYCEECLTAEGEFYYCSSPECRAKLNENIEKKPRSEEIICPNCQSIIETGPDELKSAGFRCPECETYIFISNGNPETLEDKNYVRLFNISNQGDIAIIKSLLDDAGIDYYASGENSIYDPVTLYIEEKQTNLAKEILKDFEFHLFGLSSNNGE